MNFPSYLFLLAILDSYVFLMNSNHRFTIGLNGSNQMTIGPAEYMVVGFGLLSDHEKLTIWYSKDFDELRLRANYNYGATIATFGSTAYFATNNLV